MKVNLNETAAFLRENDDFLILTHRYPDGDTLGSAFALFRGLQYFGKRARVVCSDRIPQKYNYLHNDIKFEDFEPRCVLAVDVADTKLLGSPYEERYAGGIDLCIDHHGSNVQYAKRLFLDETASAAGEMIYHLLMELGAVIDEKTAEALYTAISTDTGCFKYGNTTPEAMRIAAGLMEMGIDTQMINRLMFESRSRERIELEIKVIHSLRYAFDGRCASVFITRDMIKEAGAGDNDLEGLTSIPRTIEGVACGVTFREAEGGFKVSVRTTPPLNACEICRELGGGGHPAAAGCFVRGNEQEAYNKLIGIIGNYMEV